ncbi:M48 family metallopeptidase [Cystobacter ferrugineus]|nr:M48 family metallopeptidase [Cystobacter ferrugineus]
MAHSTGLLFRAAVAILLMVLFFSLALTASAGLVYGAYELGTFTLEHARGRGLVLLLLVAGAMGFGGLVILWSIVPRIDRFTPPGPELTAKEQPVLFQEIHRIAEMTGQEPPTHVYLVPDVNAFVTERGGWMGIGSQRVMGLGLGLVNILGVSELRAVIAHEFGHFHGGDTKLGPWIYKTRGAIIRTVQNLYAAGEASEEVGTVAFVLKAVGKPFEWFAKGYLRITQAISRAQEYSADGVAVRTQGAAALVEGLKKTHRGGLAFSAFVENELGPLLENKRHAPLGEGFRRFLGAPSVAERLGQLEKEELSEGKQDPYDTHPPLRERIRHAESLDAPWVAQDVRPAVELLADVPQLEAKLYSEWTQGATLTPIEWAESASVFVSDWQAALLDAQRGLAHGTTPLTLPTETPALRELAAKVTGQDTAHVPEDILQQWATELYMRVLSAVLVDHGFTPSNNPGEAIAFTRGELRLEPASLVRSYLRGELGREAWSASWQEAGLADAPLTPEDVQQRRSG